MQHRISNAPGAFIGVEAYQSRRTLKEQQRVYTSAEWMMARGTAMRRDNYRCKRCGRGRQDGIPLEVHHRHTLRTGGDAYELDNLVTLCRRCHHEEHPDERQREVVTFINVDGVLQIVRAPARAPA